MPPDTEVSGDPTEITIGPKKVFKRGYPTGKTVGVEGSESLGGKGMASNKMDLLTTHGVTDGSQICQVLHPREMSLLESVVNQKAFLVTKDFKVIDIAAHEWPINLVAAKDVRTNLKATVKHGGELGTVAGVNGDYVMIRAKAGDLMVSVYDLEPVMSAENPELDLVSTAIAPVAAAAPTIEYKGYTYTPSLDVDDDVTKIFHDVTAPDGKLLAVDFTPYAYMTEENLKAWIDQGMPPRKGASPLQDEDLKAGPAADAPAPITSAIESPWPHEQPQRTPEPRLHKQMKDAVKSYWALGKSLQQIEDMMGAQVVFDPGAGNLASLSQDILAGKFTIHLNEDGQAEGQQEA